MKTVYVLYSYGHQDESVYVLGAFGQMETAKNRLAELAATEKNGRLYYIQQAVLED